MQFISSKVMVLPVVMYGCESSSRGLSTKESMLLNCGAGDDSWESLGLQVNQPVNPKEKKKIKSWILIGRTDAEAEALTFWPHVWRANSLEKTLILGKIKGRRRRGLQRMRWLDSLNDSMNKNLSKFWQWRTEEPEFCSPWGHKELYMT